MPCISFNLQRAARNLYSNTISTSITSLALRTNKASLGKILAFENILITPYQHLLERPLGFSAHQGGPLWPNWDHQLEARHCRNGHPIDDLPTMLHDNNTDSITEPSAWCGAIVNHFGHQIADFSTRILQTRNAYPKIKFLFSSKASKQYTTLAQTPVLFRSLLSWYNLQPDRVKMITQPTSVRDLLVAPQAEQLIKYGPPSKELNLEQYGPSSKYLDLVDEHVDRKLPKCPCQGIIFVSRAGVKIHFAGEAYLERLMQSVGIQVMRPETLPLNEQIATYAAADQLIFSEGSALYGLQLLGRSVGQVHVLVRRPGFRLAKNLLTARTNKVSYIDVSQGILCSIHPNGNLNRCQGLPIFNEDALVSYLHSIQSKMGNRWNRIQYLAARDTDIKQWLQWIIPQTVTQSALAREHILKSLRELNLTHLVPFATECVARCSTLNRNYMH